MRNILYGRSTSARWFAREKSPWGTDGGDLPQAVEDRRADLVRGSPGYVPDGEGSGQLRRGPRPEVLRSDEGKQGL